nr:alpha-L-fucosidase [uncultured Sunxiuqinia sp.]
MLGFICLNLNTYTGAEWGNGNEDLSIFNPKKLDANQWVQTFKSAGIESIILVCKHHDGFCLWPSKYRERTIAQTPYKNGKGDIVREFVDACHKEGIGVCMYYSPWDMQKPYGKEEYNDLMINELKELLSNYGLVDLVWFDGAGIDTKTSGVTMHFDWPRIYNTIRTLQPQALISGAGPDIRWVGNEGGRGRFTEWSVQGIHLPEADFSGFDSQVPLMAANLGHIEQLQGAQQLAWYPARGGLPIRHGWFWHPGQSSRTLSYLVNSYFETVGQNSNLLVNHSPDTLGLIPEKDVHLMTDFGNYLKIMYKNNFADGATATSSSVRDGGYAANYLFDDDLRTCWVAKKDSTTGEITINLYDNHEFNVIELREAITEFGQRIEKFKVDYWTGSEWAKAGEATTIGFRRLLRTADIKTNKIRITILESRKSPSLATLKLYFAPHLVAPPIIKQDAQAKVNISSADAVIRYTIDGTSPVNSESTLVYSEPFEFPEGGLVKAVSVSEDNKSFQQISSSFAGKNPDKWKIKGLFNHKALMDFNAETWTEFSSESAPAIEIQFNGRTKIKGFSYTPKQGEMTGYAHIQHYKILMKDEDGNWQIIKTGAFGNMHNNPIVQNVWFDKTVSTDGFKIEISDGKKNSSRFVAAGLEIW